MVNDYFDDRRPPRGVTWLDRTVVLIVLVAGLALIGSIAFGGRSVGQQIAEKQADTEAWRGWFVYEMQRHDRSLGLTPLPWPGPLKLPHEPATEPAVVP